MQKLAGVIQRVERTENIRSDDYARGEIAEHCAHAQRAADRRGDVDPARDVVSRQPRQAAEIESDTDRVLRIDLATGAAAVYAEQVGRLPDGLALDAAGNLFASCYASDDIHRISPEGERTLFAYDRWAIRLSRPTNLAFRDGFLYAANFGRTTITRAQVGRAERPLANQL